MRFKRPFELELVKSQYSGFLCGQHRPEEEAQRGRKRAEVASVH